MIQQLISDPQRGFLTILDSSGTIRRQRRPEDGGSHFIWDDLDLAALPARVTHVAIGYDSLLVVACADGSLWRERRHQFGEHRAAQRWEAIPHA